jgi:serine/threonine protein kinase
MEVLDGKYQIEQLLGQGGMGAVYKAVHLGTKRTVAVKVINPQLSNRDAFIARFRREAESRGTPSTPQCRVASLLRMLVINSTRWISLAANGKYVCARKRRRARISE